MANQLHQIQKMIISHLIRLRRQTTHINFFVCTIYIIIASRTSIFSFSLQHLIRIIKTYFIYMFGNMKLYNLSLESILNAEEHIYLYWLSFFTVYSSAQLVAYEKRNINFWDNGVQQKVREKKINSVKLW